MYVQCSNGTCNKVDCPHKHPHKGLACKFVPCSEGLGIYCKNVPKIIDLMAQKLEEKNEEEKK